MRIVCHQRAHAARGSNFLLRRQKQVTKEKAAPTFALIRDLKRKRRAVRNSLRSNNGPLHRRFHSKSRGRIHGGAVEPMFDRCAMPIVRARIPVSRPRYPNNYFKFQYRVESTASSRASRQKRVLHPEQRAESPRMVQ